MSNDPDEDGPTCENCGAWMVRLWQPYRLACEECEERDETAQKQADGELTPAGLCPHCEAQESACDCLA